MSVHGLATDTSRQQVPGAQLLISWEGRGVGGGFLAPSTPWVPCFIERLLPSDRVRSQGWRRGRSRSNLGTAHVPVDWSVDMRVETMIIATALVNGSLHRDSRWNDIISKMQAKSGAGYISLITYILSLSRDRGHRTVGIGNTSIGNAINFDQTSPFYLEIHISYVSIETFSLGQRNLI